jgi:bile acid:Na+ symporter, BASS family
MQLSATMNAGALQDGLVITLNLASMLAMGLELTPDKLAGAARRAKPMAVGLGVNLVLAPALAWLLVQALALPPAIAIGLLLVAAAPGGNMGPLFTANARGDIAYAVSLVVVLSFASVVSVPLLMSVMAPPGSADFGGHAPAMMRMILVYQIAPLCLGMVVRAVRAGVAARLAPIARIVGNVSLLVLTAALIVTRGGVIVGNGLLPLAAVEAFVLLMLATGFLLGPIRDPAARALGLVSGTRNLACSMLLGSQVFGDQPEVMLGLLAYGLLWLPTTMPLSFWLKRFAS